MSGSLEGQVAVVVGGSTVVGREVALGLADRGAAVGVVGETSWATRAEAEEAFAAVVAEHGPIDIVVHALTEPDAFVPTPFMDVDEATWERTAETPLWAAVLTFQAAHTFLRERGGRLLVVFPTSAMTGAPLLAASASAAEGQRSLVKAAARTWGELGITIHSVGVPVELFAAAGDPASQPHDRPGLPGPALAPPEPRADISGVIALLASPEAAVMTGMTVSVDGGVWMTP